MTFQLHEYFGPPRRDPALIKVDWNINFSGQVVELGFFAVRLWAIEEVTFHGVRWTFT